MLHSVTLIRENSKGEKRPIKGEGMIFENSRNEASCSPFETIDRLK